MLALRLCGQEDLTAECAKVFAEVAEFRHRDRVLENRLFIPIPIDSLTNALSLLALRLCGQEDLTAESTENFAEVAESKSIATEHTKLTEIVKARNSVAPLYPCVLCVFAGTKYESVKYLHQP